MSFEAGFIVEGHCERDSLLSFISKIIGNHYFPISNAQGIGNITKNVHKELLFLCKAKPKKVFVLLDYREAEREGLVSNCIELKELVQEQCESFMNSQQNGSMHLPDQITVIIVDKTYETWLCSDYEGLKTNELINETLITETYTNVDIEIPNPSKWINSKLHENIDLKKRENRKTIAKTMRPEIAKDNSRSFRKFYEEILKINVA